MMSHKHSSFTLSFVVSEGSIKPLKDIAWIITLRHQVEVHIVASLSVDNNNIHTLNIFKVAIGILDSKALRVVAVLSIYSLRFLIEVLIPDLSIIGYHGILLGKVLGVGLNEIMITLKWVKAVGG